MDKTRRKGGYTRKYFNEYDSSKKIFLKYNITFSAFTTVYISYYAIRIFKGAKICKKKRYNFLSKAK